MEIEFAIDKEDVYKEVAQTTSYTGANMDGDENAYERITTTDEDQSMLDRFWYETCASVSDVMRRYISEEGDNADGSELGAVVGYRYVMELSNSFNEVLEGPMHKDLYSFFVMSITAKWFGFTNKKEAAEYATAAASFLDSFRRKAVQKKSPKRPTYKSAPVRKETDETEELTTE
jgi:hypothetical protein